jgi:hypothetical protein
MIATGVSGWANSGRSDVTALYWDVSALSATLPLRACTDKAQARYADADSAQDSSTGLADHRLAVDAAR